MDIACRDMAAGPDYRAQDLTGMLTERSMGDELFHRFSELIYSAAGIRLDVRKKGLLTSRLSRRLSKLKMNSFLAYYRFIKEHPDEQVEMLNCISTNTTRFFREPHHFEHLRDRIIPELMRNVSTGRLIRIWSAGCSTGEEPYSIAITISEGLRRCNVDPLDWDIKILATDISTKVLDAGRRGIYDYNNAVAGLDKDIVARYFLKGTNGQAGMVRVKDSVKNMVRFGRLNFKERTYPFNRSFDAIFCRNVMIYFDDEMKQQVIGKFHSHLSAGGHLFLGHSETMLNSGTFSPVNITVYRKR